MKYSVLLCVVAFFGLVSPSTQALPTLADLKGMVFTGQYVDPNMPFGVDYFRVAFTNGSIDYFSMDLGVFSPDISGFEFNAPLIIANPPDACSSLLNTDATNAIVLIIRGSCTFQAKTFNAQQAGAKAVIIYNNAEGLIRMGGDTSGANITIPAFSTLKSVGLLLASEVQLSHVSQAMISRGTENSLRVNILTTNAADSTITATVELRTISTQTYYSSSNYGQLRASGTYNPTTGALSLSPDSWVVRPYSYGSGKEVHTTLFGLEGTISGVGLIPVLHGSSMPPFSSSFHARRQPSYCQVQLRSAMFCNADYGMSLSEETSCSDYKCNLAIDHFGYHIFNDHSCPTSQPLTWNCEQEGSGSCQGDSIVLPSSTSCTAAGQVDKAYVTYFPANQSLSLLNDASLTWWTNCSSNFPYSGRCPAGGWVMKGNYIYSGANRDASRSTLNVRVVIGAGGGAFNLNVKVDGERSYDYLSIYLNGRLIGSSQSYNFPMDYWHELRYPLPAGTHMIQFTYYKDASVSTGLDGVFIRTLAFEGTAVQECSSCPIGTCADVAVQECHLCDRGTYNSAVGQSSCSPCQNTIVEAWAQYTLGATTGICPVECIDGYTMVGGSCVPLPNHCILQNYNSLNLESSAPAISFSMLQQCLAMIPSNATYNAATISAISTVAPLYPYYAAPSSSPTSFSLSQLPTLSAKTYPNDFSFHSELMKKIRSFNDPTFKYKPPLFYSHLGLYLPFKLALTSGKIYIKSLNAAALYFGYARPSASPTFNAHDFVGYTVTKIGSLSAIDAIQNFADEQVGMSNDKNIRLNLALNTMAGVDKVEWLNVFHSGGNFDDTTHPAGYPQTMLGMWTCGFTYRSLGLCDPPSASDVLFELLSPGGKTVTLSIPWTVIFNGDEPVRATPDTISSYIIPRNINNYYAPCYLGTELLHPNAFLWPVVPPVPTEISISQRTLAVAGGKLEMINIYDAVSGYLFTSDFDGVKTGILEIRQFIGESNGIKDLLAAFNAENIERIVVDLRHNIGGSICHAHQLAYLLSSKFESPDYNSTYINFRNSKLLQDLFRAQSAKASDHEGKGSSYYSELRQFDYREYADMASDEELSDDSWLTTPVTRSLGGSYTDSFTSDVRLFCEVHGGLMTNSEACYGPDTNYLDSYWQNMLGGSSYKELKTYKLRSFSSENFIVLSDGLCVGACSVFTQLLQRAGAVRTVAVGGTVSFPGGTTMGASMSASGVVSSMTALYCQLKDAGLSEADSASFPLLGQDLQMSVAQIYFGKEDTGISSQMTTISTSTFTNMNIQLAQITNQPPYISTFIGSLPSITQEFEICVSEGETRDCSSGNGVGTQICVSSSSSTLMWGKCSFTKCVAGYLPLSGKCVSQNVTSTLEEIENILNSDSAEARAVRQKLELYLFNLDGTTPGTKGLSGGGVFGVSFVCLLLGAAIGILVYKYKDSILVLFARTARSHLSTSGSSAPRSHSVEIPMENTFSLSGPPSPSPPPRSEERAPNALRQSGFLANLQTRKSRGSVSARDEAPDTPMLLSTDDASEV